MLLQKSFLLTMVGVCITVSGVQSLSHSPWNIIQEGKKYTLSTFFSLFFSTRYDTKPDKSWWRKKTCLKASHLKVKFMWCESLIRVLSRFFDQVGHEIHLVEISIFSLNNVTVRLAKIMKVSSNISKVIFQCWKLVNFWNTLFSKIGPNFGRSDGDIM